MVVQCTALLNLELIGVLDVSFSSCTVLNYLVLMSKYFSGIPGTPRISGDIRSVLEFRSNLELECSPERGEHRGQVGS